ncbi:MAG: Fic family protein [Bacteroidetes bacterium]|uniref:Fic family protein n=1 Tax=Candidatus Cryptobacteroides faecavium TaxID=2840762 RepID=A0A9D9NEU6_9BACT|nr:Fic family protein [Candidatus Cryptobacteroides faecavium]
MYIYEHKAWPSFSWNKELVNIKLNEVNKAVGYLMGRLSVIGFNDKMSATVESISHDIIASSEIEGVELNNGQVRSSVARKLGVQLQNPSESSRYVDGVVEMALDATVNFNSPLTDERLFGWHSCLFPTGWSGSTKVDVGQYRNGEMKVVSGMFGREKVHYAAPAPEKIREEMNRFLDWFNSDTHNGYIKSAIAHLWFVCIHPFDDGNGRIGRAIADMALSQAENSGMRFFSISHQINRDKKQYYAVLEKTQKGDCDITEWIIWYLDCLLRSVGQSDETLSKVLDKAVFWQNHAETVLSERQREVLNRYLDGCPGKLTVKNWAKCVKVSPDTAARDIKDLVEKGVLVPQQGRVRDVFYGIRCSESVLAVPMSDDM